MPFLTKQTVTAKNANGDTLVHSAGTVLSDWELSDFIRSRIQAGEQWYRERFEPLVEREAHAMRVKATAEEGPRDIEGNVVAPPYDDYVGLHPNEIIQRMNTANLEKVRQVKLYERAGMNRSQIVAFVTPAEREPWAGYDQQSIGDILEKFSVLSDPAVAEAKLYEANHRQRPVILGYDRATYELTEPPAGSEAVASESQIPTPPPAVPEPQPATPQVPVSPAPPMSGEGALTDPGQFASQQQVAVTPPQPELATMGAPPS